MCPVLTIGHSAKSAKSTLLLVISISVLFLYKGVFKVVSHIFGVIADTISNFITSLTSAVTGIQAILYDSTNGFSFLGTLLLIAVGMGIVYWTFRLLRGCVAGLAR